MGKEGRDIGLVPGGKNRREPIILLNSIRIPPFILYLTLFIFILVIILDHFFLL